MSDDPPGAGAPPDPPKVTKLSDVRARERAVRAPSLEESMAARKAKVRQILGEDCPYEPIGHDGKYYWLLDCDKHLQMKTPRELSRNEMVSFCGSDSWLKKHYPRSRHGKPVLGFATEEATANLMQCCKIMGRWSRALHERGLGAWSGDDGDLIVHRGNLLVIKGVARPLGRYGEFVYTPRQALPMLPLSTDRLVARAAHELTERLDSFTWQRGSFDTVVTLGWTCAAMLGGALGFRPHLWVTAGLGAGKSTLYLLLSTVFTPAGILAVTDTTAAGIRQSMDFGSIPVAYDEFEAAEDPTRQTAVIKVIRDSSSGGMTLRGGAGHEAASFPVVSCFACMSIIVPPMTAADLSRFLVLHLTSQDGLPPRIFNVDRLQQIGAALQRRMIDRYEVLTTEVLPQYRAALMTRGATRRIADLFGTIFACAAVALYDDVAQMRFEETWLGNHHMETMLAQALAEQTDEWRRALDYLMATPIDRLKPDLPSYGELIERAGKALRGARADATGRLFGDDADRIIGDDDDSERAGRRLLTAGMMIVTRLPDGPLPEPMLVVANTHRVLGEIFRETIWRTLPHAAGGGGWSQVFRRAPGARVTKRLRFRGGVQSTAVAIPLNLVLMPDAPAPRAAEAKPSEDDAAAMLH